jgi:hypothetical protein
MPTGDEHTAALKAQPPVAAGRESEYLPLLDQGISFLRVDPLHRGILSQPVRCGSPEADASLRRHETVDVVRLSRLRGFGE